jgi:hypothetical protein
MPELPVKERLSELHLPEIKRDDIVRSLSEMRLPDVDVTKLERPKIELPDAVSKFEWPKIDLSSMDLGKAIAGAVAAAHIGSRARRPRWPLVVGGLIVAGFVTWAILTNETIRARLASGASAVRDRLASMRADADDGLDVDHDAPIAFNAAETAPMEVPPYAEGSTDAAGTDYPEGLGIDRDNGVPAVEQAGERD